MNTAIFSPREAAKLCNSLSFPTRASSATSPLLQPGVAVRNSSLLKHRIASSKDRHFQRICFKAVMETVVGANHFRTPPKPTSCSHIPTAAGSQTVPVPHQSCPLTLGHLSVVLGPLNQWIFQKAVMYETLKSVNPLSFSTQDWQ